MMFLAGAELNYFEYNHNDIISSHKLFIDHLSNYNQLFKTCSNLSNSPQGCRKISNWNDTHEEREASDIHKISFYSNINSSFLGKRRVGPLHKSIGVNNWMIFNNINSGLFIQSILCDEKKLKKIDKNDYFLKLNRIFENIREKLRIDSIVRPLRIFWVKADYIKVGNLVAVIGTGIGLVASILLKSFDLSKLITAENK